MTNKEISFCYELASFMCHPQAIAIGEAGHCLKNIVRELTVNSKKIRNQVFEFIEDFVADDDFDKSVYGEYMSDALEMIKEDYDVAFYQPY